MNYPRLLSSFKGVFFQIIVIPKSAMFSEVLALVLLGLASTVSAQDPNQQQQGQAPALMDQTTMMMMIMMLQKVRSRIIIV